jgi:hypothetical protein
MRSLDARATATGLTREGDIRSEAKVPVSGLTNYGEILT